MAKGPVIPDDVKRDIAEVYLEHRDWRAKEIQSEVNSRLLKRNPRLSPDWPGLSAVQKQLTQIRKKYKNTYPDPEDEKWTIATLEQYPIHSEALPFVLQVWAEFESKNEKLTIREAKWVARLYTVTRECPFNYLTTFVDNYASAELATKIAGINWDSTLLDSLLYSMVTGENNEQYSKRLQRIYRNEYKDRMPTRSRLEAWEKEIRKEAKEDPDERSHSKEVQK